MKLVCSIFFSLILSLNCFGQSQTHKGFYLSMGLGPGFGDIHANANTGENMTITGTAYAFDVMLGGTPMENFVVHATIGIKSIFGPTINDGTRTVTLNDSYSVDEFLMGVGVTQYLPQNFLVSATIGSANFSFEADNVTFDTDNGFSYQLKVGKEWWVSSRWSLGVSMHYAATSLTSKYTDGTSEKWRSSRFGILLQGTLHGKRD